MLYYYYQIVRRHLKLPYKTIIVLIYKKVNVFRIDKLYSKHIVYILLVVKKHRTANKHLLICIVP